MSFDFLRKKKAEKSLAVYITQKYILFLIVRGMFLNITLGGK